MLAPAFHFFRCRLSLNSLAPQRKKGELLRGTIKRNVRCLKKYAKANSCTVRVTNREGGITEFESSRVTKGKGRRVLVHKSLYRMKRIMVKVLCMAAKTWEAGSVTAPSYSHE